MYSEAKLEFFIFLWYPKTKGTTYVYDSFFRLYVAKHATEIDRNLLELRTRAGDIAVLYWQRVSIIEYMTFCNFLLHNRLHLLDLLSFTRAFARLSFDTFSSPMIEKDPNDANLGEGAEDQWNVQL
ncbi:HVA22-like protein i [Glycine soja]|uniref:HVA22-like protein i n=1 Tax=Glycine soja TaxID=3848 RepID=A0A445JXT0_GLYSO|nr:HVA22-like protein i [Glycine soja]